MAVPLLKQTVVSFAKSSKLSPGQPLLPAHQTLKTFAKTFCLFALTALCFPPPGWCAVSPTNAPAVLLTAEGRVEVSRPGVTAWSAARVEQPLQTGDRVRTGLRSRAVLRLSDLSVLRLNELTTIEVRPPAKPGRPQSADIKSGGIYFFNREKPVDLEFRTPVASGAIRGTAFAVDVAEAGRTVITMLEGTVELKNEAGQIALASGEQGTVEAGQPPRKTAMLDAVNVIQWALYYPGVLDPEEAGLSPAERTALDASLQTYRSGDLLAAVAAYPENRPPASDAARVYQAATLLAVGRVPEAEALLKGVASPLADALHEVVAVVKNQSARRPSAPATATEWMAESYWFQSKSQLEAARNAARSATQKSPGFGFAWVRLAELEFSFGRTDAALAALEKGLQLSPRNAQGLALKGFLLAAQNKMAPALAQFDQAIAADGGLGNAWLGRGLCRIRTGRETEGRQDLQVAATLEPQRAVLRSYLGKAWSQTREQALAEKELSLARNLDPNDPTSWLYSALFNQQNNRINEAVRDLEKSQELNANRSLFRSQLLLDQDQAVRSANLAGIYRDAGLTDVAIREASRAVNYDYANYSAHLFLAGSYDAMRDPKGINLRYGTPFLSELLVANLLAPPGAGNLSQSLSQNEYSKLFQRDRLGLSSSTEYFSRGDWIQRASQYGNFGGTAYAVDLNYHSENGYRPNNDLEETFYAVSFKQQITRKDSILLQINGWDWKAGDVAQYYNQNSASPSNRVSEKQAPNLYAGYHREWAPDSHTLFLFGRLDSTVTQTNPAATIPTFNRTLGGDLTSINTSRRFGLDYQREVEAYTAELQHIWQKNPVTLIAGGRYQDGSIDDRALLTRSPVAFPPIYSNPPSDQNLDLSLQRYNFYAYSIWQLLDSLQITAGVSYDHVGYPRNSEVPPLSTAQDDRSQVSPKAGLTWQPWKNGTLRAVYSQSLGGVYYDNSVRLEPTQIAGFNQAFRSLIPESVAGIVPGTRFETLGVAFDQKFKTGTYVTLSGEALYSKGSRTLGNFDYNTVPPATPSGFGEELQFRERSLLISVNQLLGDNFSLGARYRLTDAALTRRFPAIPASIPPGTEQHTEATLHQLDLYALAYHRCGFFGQFDALWNSQANRGYAPAQPGDDFWQFNVFVGYRFARRHAEVRLGILNLADRNYALNPLTLYSELARERTFVAGFKFWF